jgi:hypothetical protein
MKIAFGLYNQLSNRSAEYQAHIRAMTNFAMTLQVNQYNWANQQQAQVIEDSSIDNIIKQADQQSADYLYVVGYGYRSYNPNLVNLMIADAEANDYSVVGHILQEKNYYSLHYQCFLINMRHWRALGSPAFGNHDQLTNQALSLPERSADNVHDDYTPWFLHPTGQTVTINGSVSHGWNLISAVLATGRKIGNFSHDIRRFKQHLYPEVGAELERLLAGDQTVEVQEYNQKQYVQLMDFRTPQSSVYVFNTDPMTPDYIAYNKNNALGSIYCVAAGFKPIQLMTQCGWTAQTRMVYFDYSKSALDFKRWLVENWDGIDYPGAVNTYITTVDPSFRPVWHVGQDQTPEWEKTIAVFGGQEAWLELWNKYSKLEHRYIQTNLFDDKSELIKDISSHRDNNLIWFSNSFYTEACLMNFSPAALDKLYKSFIEELEVNSDSIQICGLTNAGTSAWQHIGQIK